MRTKLEDKIQEIFEKQVIVDGHFDVTETDFRELRALLPEDGSAVVVVRNQHDYTTGGNTEDARYDRTKNGLLVSTVGISRLFLQAAREKKLAWEDSLWDATVYGIHMCKLLARHGEVQEFWVELNRI